MIYTCKFNCGVQTETLNELKWHYQTMHKEVYNYFADIQPIIDQMMIESGAVEPGDIIYPDGTWKKYNPWAALFWFVVVALLPALAIGAVNVYMFWEVLPHQTALVIGVLVFMLAFLVGGVGSLMIQMRDSKVRSGRSR